VNICSLLRDSVPFEITHHKRRVAFVVSPEWKKVLEELEKYEKPKSD